MIDRQENLGDLLDKIQERTKLEDPFKLKIIASVNSIVLNHGP